MCLLAYSLPLLASRSLPSYWLLSPLLLPWLLSQATATACKWNAAALRSHYKTPSSPLITLHVQTLKLRTNGGARPPYKMRALRVLRATPA